jgi:hypothetical protein
MRAKVAESVILERLPEPEGARYKELMKRTVAELRGQNTLVTGKMKKAERVLRILGKEECIDSASNLSFEDLDIDLCVCSPDPLI